MAAVVQADVIIVGAGAAGLAAARVLADAGRSVLILEARDRIGGRMFTLTDSKLKIPIELGAEFIHGLPPATWALVREAGLTALDLPFDYKRYQHGRLVDLPDIDSELQKVMGGLAHLGHRDKSFAQYLRDRRTKGSAEARRFAISFIEGFDAADPQRISAQSLAEEQRGIGDLEKEGQFRLLHGYGSLVDYLHRQLDARRVRIRVRYPVAEIGWEKGKVEIRSRNRRDIARARRALITLPLGMLQLPPEIPGAVRFTPDISTWRGRSMQLASGHVVKAIFRFREPFWEADKNLRDAAFMLDPSGPIPTWWTMRPLRVPVLTAWTGGPKARALVGLSANQLRHLAIESLAKLTKHRPRRLIGLIEQFYCHDWGSDPFSRGAYSYVTVGGTSARPQLARPIENTLFFAGEALDTSGEASTVGGALASGQHAAKALLAGWRPLTI